MGKPVHSLNFFRNSEDENAKVYAVIAFAAIFILVGVPLWWKTTEVYRDNLPYGEIEALSSIKLTYHLDIIVIITDDSIKNDVLQKIEATLNRSTDLKGSLSGELLKEIYRWTVRHMYEEERQIFKSSKAPSEILEKMHNTKILEEPGFLKIFVLPSSSSILSDSTAFYIGKHRSMLYKTGTDIILGMSTLLDIMENVLVKKEDLLEKILSIKSPEVLQQDLASMRSPQFHPAYDVTFTLVNPQPSKVEVQWDIEEAIKKHLQPMFRKLSFYANFHVKSQVLLLTSLNVQTYFDRTNHWHYLKLDQLPQVINPLETRLGSYISTNPSLNFIVYIPSSDQSPLLIYDHDGKPSKSNAFLSPRWGGILIYNNLLKVQNNTHTAVPMNLDMNKVMRIFVGQLRLLLGLNFKVEDFETKLSSYDESSIMDWELDYLMRIRAYENLLTATFTLNSLAQLLEEIKYIVINEEVGQHVSNAVESVKNGFLALESGNLSEAFIHSKQGFISAEKAFFDPSMLALLYFPDDQKYAVYTPLFLPVSIPVLSSLFVLWRVWKNQSSS